VHTLCTLVHTLFAMYSISGAKRYNCVHKVYTKCAQVCTKRHSVDLRSGISWSGECLDIEAWESKSDTRSDDSGRRTGIGIVVFLLIQ
jgi:hypothetical protein